MMGQEPKKDSQSSEKYSGAFGDCQNNSGQFGGDLNTTGQFLAHS